MKVYRSALPLLFGSSVLFSACFDSIENKCELALRCPSNTEGGDGGAGAGGDGSGIGGTEGGRGGSSGGGSGNAGLGGAAGGGGDAGSGGECSEPTDVVEDLCVDEVHGVFVSPRDGNDATGDGTRSKPFASIRRALDAAATANAPHRVYACADGGDYAESVAVETEHDGLEVFGGYHCDDWSYDAELKSRVRSRDATAWTIEALARGFRIEDFDIAAADATEEGKSSFGLVVRESENVVLRRVNVSAGKGGAGAAGADGGAGAQGPNVNVAQQGSPATCDSAPLSQNGGAWSIDSACGSRGGPGGQAIKGISGGDGFAGLPVTNVTPPDVDNGGPNAVGTGGGSDGGTGSPGNNGSSGKATASEGTFTASGFAPSPAAGSGSVGFPGQGGGGGGASNATGKAMCIGASGGAGGMGGCGGQPGKGGSGGGASVALLSWNSDVTLEQCELVAVDGGDGGVGGNGGAGGLGRAGAPGGVADTTNGIGKGGSGGKGGDGGFGGPGAGGNGGPSYAVVYSGTRPSQLGTTLTPGRGGARGVGGTAAGARASDGNVGASARDLSIP